MASTATRKALTKRARHDELRTALRPLAISILLAFGNQAAALPTDPTVVAGQASVSNQGASNLVVRQSTSRAAIDWRTFNIASNEWVRFEQPSSSATMVNRVTTGNPSQILGRMSAPGTLYLINPGGVIFGRTATVDVNNLIASALNANPQDLVAGRLNFSAPAGSTASVRNEGTISSAPGGSVTLLGTQVSNSGTISTPGGTTGLIAGERVVVDFEGDGLVRYQVDAAAAQAQIAHSGRIDADGGRVALQAGARQALLDTVLNIDGIVRARGATLRNGEIYLDGGRQGVVSVSGQLDASSPVQPQKGGDIRVLGDKVGLFGNARLDASGVSGGGQVLIGGNYQGQGSEPNARNTYVGKNVSIAADAISNGDGGKVIVWADDWTRYYGTISAQGGAQGGDGGFVEVSGKKNLAFDGRVSTSAPHGKAGTLLLDPSDLYVGADPTPTGGSEVPLLESPSGSGVFNTLSDPENTTYYVNASQFTADANYSLIATQNIHFNSAITFGSTAGKNVLVRASNAIDWTGTTVSDYAKTVKTSGANLTLESGTTMELGRIDTGTGALIINNGGLAIQHASINAGSLQKTGVGTLVLNQTTDFTGGLLIDAGTLRLDAANVLHGPVTLANTDGATLDLNGTSQTIGPLSGGGTTGGNITFGDSASASTLLNINQTTDQIFGGTITGSGHLTKTGNAKLTLSRDNSYGGGTTISTGTLSVQAANALGSGVATVESGATLNINGVTLTSPSTLTLSGVGVGVGGAGALTGTGNAGYNGTLALAGDTTLGADSGATLTLGGALDQPTGSNYAVRKAGPGTVVLNNASSDYGGGTTIDAGTLRLGAANVLHGPVTLANTDGATLDLNGTSQTIGPLSGGGTTGGNITFGDSASASTLLNINQTTDQIFGGTITGSGHLTKTGNAKLTLSRDNSYGGGTTISTGTLSVQAANALGSGAATVESGATLNINGVTLTSPSTLTLSGAGVGVGGAGALTGTGNAGYNGTLALAGDTTLGADSGATLTLGGALDQPTGSNYAVRKAGPGTVVLNNASSDYGGGTTIDAGTLRLGAANVLHGPVTLANTDGATLDLNGTSQTIGPLSGGGTTGGNITFGDSASASTLLNINQTTDQIFGGTITGSGHLTKTGNAKLTLSRDNSYGGGTTISTGTLSVQAANALGSGVATVESGATLNINGVTLTSPSTLTLSGVGVGVGVGGAGALTGTGNAGYNGTLALAGDTTLGADSGATLTLGGALDQPTGSNYAVRKAGPGTVVLNNASSDYGGGTTIDAGTLRLGAANVLHGPVTLANTDGATLDLNGTSQTIGPLSGGGTTGGNITFGDSASASTLLNINQTTDQIFGGTITGSGHLTKTGNAKLTLSRDNSYGGGTTISTGTLSVQAANALGSGVATVESGATLNINGVTLTSPATLTLSGAGVNNAGALTGTGTAGYGGTLALAGNTTLGADSGAMLTLGGALDQPAGSNYAVRKAGAGTVVLNNASSDYGGGTTIDAGTLRLGAANVLHGPVTLANTDGATLDLNGTSQMIGPLSGGGTTGGNITFGDSASASTLLNINQTTDQIFGGTITGSGHLTKTGNAKLTLSRDNSYGGGTTISTGTLSVQAANALGSGVATVESGATLNINGVTLTSPSTLTLSGVGVNNAGALTGTGIAGYGGTLALAGNTTLGADSGATMTLGGALDQPANTSYAVRKAGTGTVVLSNNGSDYGGGTTIGAGTLSVTSANALSTGPVTVESGATLNINGVTLTSPATLTLSGAGVNNAGALTGTGTAGYGGTLALAGNTTLGADSGATMTLGGALDQPANTSYAVRKAGTGTVVLSNNGSDYGGGTVIDAGTLSVTSANALSTGPVTVESGATLNINGVTLTSPSTLTLSGVGAGVNNAGALTGTGNAGYNGTLALAGDTTLGADSGATLTLGGALDQPTGSNYAVRKAGPGTVVLNNASSDYGGGTTIDAGTLRLGAANVLHGPVTLANTDGATLDLNGTSQTIGPLSGGGTTGGNITFGDSASASTLLNINQTTDQIFGGTITGSGHLTKTGNAKLTLSRDNSYGGGTTISTGTLSVQAANALGSGVATVESGATLNINGVTLTSPATLTLSGAGVNNAGALTGTGTAGYGGTLALAGNTTLGADSGAMLTLGGALDQPAGSNYAVRKAGAGTVVLNNASSDYGGGTTIDAGTLRLGAANVLHGPVTLANTDGATLDLNGTSQMIGPLSGGGTTGGNITFGDSASASTLLNINQTTDQIFGGTITGSGHLTKTGNAKLTLSRDNSYGGGTTISTGTLSVQAANALGSGVATVESGATLNINGVTLTSPSTLTLSGVGVNNAGALTGTGIAGYGGTLALAGNTTLGADSGATMTLGGALDQPANTSYAVRKAGTGTVVLSNNGSDYGGGTTIGAGTLSVTSANALSTGPVTVESGATLNINGVTLTSPATLTLSGAGVNNAGALTGTGTAGYGGTLALAGNTTLGADSGATMTLGGALDQPANTSYAVRKAGTGTVVLSNNGSDYGGGTVIDAGTLSVTSANALSTGPVTVESGATLNINGVTLTSPSTLTLSGVGAGVNNAGALTGTGNAGYNGTLALAGDTTLGADSGATLTLGGALDQPTGSNYAVRKAGPGTVVLNNASSDYGGGTTIDAGTLRLGAANVLHGPVTLANTDGATLDLNGTSQTIGPLSGGGTTGGNITFGDSASASTLLNINQTTDQIFGGTITGSGHLTKTGNAKLTLSRDNSYGGGTTISTGTLSVQAANALGSGVATVESGATLNINGVTLTSPSTLTLSGAGVNNAGALTGTGNAGYNGTLALAGDTTLGADPGGATLTLGGALDQPAGSNYAVRKAGAGTVVLNNAGSDYSGGTAIDAGTLRLGAPNILHGPVSFSTNTAATLDLNNFAQTIGTLSGGTSGSQITLGSAALTVTQNTDNTFDGAISGSGSLIKDGSATLTLRNATSTYSGGTAINRGVVSVTSDNALGSGMVQVSPNATLRLDGSTSASSSVTIANDISLNGGDLQAEQSATLSGAVSQTAASTISAPASNSSITLQQIFDGHGFDLTLSGNGQIILANGAQNLAVFTQQSGTLLLGNSVNSSGDQSYLGIVRGSPGSVQLTSTGGSISAVHALNSWDIVSVSAAQAVNLAGRADTLDAQAGGTLASTVNTSGAATLRSTGGGALSQQGNIGGRLTTDTSGDTTLGGDFGQLAVQNSAALHFHTTHVGQDANLHTSGPVEQNGPLVVGGTTTLDAGTQAVTLSDTGNDFGGPLTLTAGRSQIADANTLAVALNTGDTTLTSGGALTASGRADTLDAQAGGTLASTVNTSGAATLRSTGGGALSQQGNIGGRLTTDTSGDTTLGGDFGQLAVQNSAALHFHTTHVGQDANLHTSGPVEQNGPLVVGGTTTLDAGTQAVTLSDTGNDFGGPLTLTAGRSQITDANTLAVALNTGDTTLTSGGALTASGRADTLDAQAGGTLASTVNTSGAATLRSTGGGALSQQGNIGGRLTTDTSGDTTLGGDFGQLAVQNSAALHFHTTHVGQDANLHTSGPVEQNGPLVVGGTTTLDAGTQAVTLSDTGNDFGGPLTLTAGRSQIADANTLAVALNTGDTTLTSGGALTASGRADTLDAQAGGTLASTVNTSGAATLRSTGGGALSQQGNIGGRLTTDTSGDTTLGGDFGQLAVQNSAALHFHTTHVGQDANLHTSGPVEQNGPLVVGGTTTLDAGTQAVTLSDTGNDFGGPLTLTAGRSQIADANTLAVALNTGDTTLTSGGVLTASGRADTLDAQAGGTLASTVNTSGAATLRSTGGGALSQQGNIGGRLTTDTSGDTTLGGDFGQLAVQNSAALHFHTTHVGQDANLHTSGPVEQNGPLVVGGTTTLDAGTQAVTLSDTGNDFGGPLTLTAGRSQITDANTLAVALNTGDTTLTSGGALTASGRADTLDAQAGGTLASTVNTSGAATLRSTGGGALSQQGNIGGRLTTDTSGDTTLGGDFGQLAVQNSAALHFHTTHVGQDANLHTSGPVEQNGPLVVGGTTTLDAGTQAVTLSDTGNDFGGPLTLTAGRSQIADANTLAVALNTGDTTLTSGGALTASGRADTLDAQAGGTLASTVNTSGAATLRSTGGGALSQQGNIGGRLTTDTSGDTTLGGDFGQLAVQNSAALHFHTTHVGQDANLHTSGPVEQNGPLVVGGTTTLDAGTQAVTLSDTGNDFGGPLTLTAGRSQITDANTLAVALNTGDTTLTSGGALTASGRADTLDAQAGGTLASTVNTSGAATLRSTGGGALSQQGNIGGRLTTDTSGDTTLGGDFGQLAVQNSAALHFHTTHVGQDANLHTSGPVEQNGPLVVGGTTTLDAGTQAVTLSDTGNDFGGPLTLTAGRSQIADANTLAVALNTGDTTLTSGGALTASGRADTLDAQAGGTLASTVNTSGAATLRSTGGGALSQQGNIGGRLTTDTSGDTTLGGDFGQLAVQNSAALHFHTTHVGQDANLHTSGPVEQNGPLVVGGTTTLDAGTQAVTLSDTGNDFGGPLTLTAGRSQIADANTLAVALNTGDTTLTSGGALTASGRADTLDAQAGGTLASTVNTSGAATLRSTGGGALSQQGNIGGRLTTDTSGDTTLGGDFGQLAVQNSAALHFHTTHVGQDANLHTSGPVEQNGPLVVGGTTTLDAGTQAVTLSDTGNDFGGPLTLTAGRSQIADANTLAVALNTGDTTLTSGGALTASGRADTLDAQAGGTLASTVNTSGAATLRSTGGGALSQQGNIGGRLTTDTSGDTTLGGDFGQLAVQNSAALHFHTTHVGQDANLHTSGPVEQNGPLVVGGTTTLDAGTQAVTLSDTGNDFGGPLTLTAGRSQITDANTLAVALNTGDTTLTSGGALTASGRADTLDAQAGGTLASTVNTSGAATLRSTGGGALSQQGNIGGRLTTDTSGDTTLGGDFGQLAVQNSAALHFHTTHVGQDANLHTSGPVEQNGPLVVGGTTTLDAGTQAVTLSDTGNDFGGPLTLTAGRSQIADANTLAVALNTGDTTLTSGGALTASGRADTLDAQAGGTLASTVNTSGAATLRSTGGGALSQQGNIGGRLTTDTSGDTTLGGDFGQLAVQNSAALHFHTTHVGQDANLHTSGPVEQNGPLVVGGTTTLDAGTQAVTLSDTGNDFGGPLTLTAGRSQIADANTLAVALNTGDTTLTSGGALTASGRADTLDAQAGGTLASTVNTSGAATLRSTGGGALSQQGNIGGRLTTDTSGDTTLGGDFGQLAVQNSAALHFHTTHVGQDANLHTSGPVEQNGPLVVGGTTTLDAGTQAVTLSDTGNDFGGPLTLTAGRSQITDANTLAVALNTGDTTLTSGGALTASGRADTLDAQAGGTLASTVNTSGAATLRSTGGGALSQQGNIGGRLTTDTSGDTTLGGDFGQLAVQNSAALHFHTTHVGQDANLHTSGPVEQNGPLVVGGTTTLDAGTQAVTLSDTGNDFGGPLTLTAGRSQIADANTLAVALNTGDTTLTSGGALTASGRADTLDAQAGGTLASTVNTSGAATLRSTGGGALSQQGNIGGRLTTDTSGDTTLGGDFGQLAVQNSAALHFHTTHVGQDANLHTSGPVEQNGPLVVGGTTTLDAGTQAVTLSDTGNDFGGPLTLTAGRSQIADANTLAVALNTGDTTLTSGGALTASGRADTLDAQAGGTLASTVNTSGAATLRSTGGGALSQQGNIGGRLTTDTSGDTTLGGDFGQLAVQNSAALHFHTTHVGQDANLHTSGPVEQNGPLVVGGTTTLDAGTQAVTLSDTGNDFGGPLTLTAGRSQITDANTLAVALNTGDTTLTSGGALTASGRADTLDAQAGGTLASTVNTSGAATLRSTGGGALSQQGNIGGRLTTDTSGDTTLGGDFGQLAVQNSAALHFHTTHVGQDANLHTSGPVEQNGPLVVGGTTTLDAGTQAVTLSDTGNDFGGPLTLTAGATNVNDSNTLVVGLNTGNTRLSANQLSVSGTVTTSSGAQSQWTSATTVELGNLRLNGNGNVSIVAEQDYANAGVEVPAIAVQDVSGTPAQLKIYPNSIFQRQDTRISSQPGVSLQLEARHASIDLSANAGASRNGSNNLQTTLPGIEGLIRVFSHPDVNDARQLTRSSQSTNDLQGPVSAVTSADVNQSGPNKSVIALASDTITIAANPGPDNPAVDADTVLLLARQINGGGGKIQTHVAASALSGRNVNTTVPGSANSHFDILPSLFILNDATNAPVTLPTTPINWAFGSGQPISIGFGHAGSLSTNSMFQTIAATPFRNDVEGGNAPIYLTTRQLPNNETAGVVLRALVFPSALPITAIRPVVIDGTPIGDSSAFGSVQAAIGETMTQVRSEQLESGFSNENVAAQLRKGVVTETRVGQAAVNRFLGVASVTSCPGMTVNEDVVCATAAGEVDQAGK